MSSGRTVLAVVIAALGQHRASLLELARTAASGGGEELVHDARVALRRLAAVARLSRGVPSGGDGEALRVAARDLRRHLSPARTAEVCHALLVSRAAPGRTSRARARRLARELFPEGLGRVPVDPHALRVVARVAADRAVELRRAAAEAGEPLRLESRLARRVERRVAQSVFRLARLLPPRARDLHLVRIAAKHARYAIELAKPFLTDEAEVLVSLREFQEAAGDAHDRQELEAALAGAARARPELEALRREIGEEARSAAARARGAGRALLELLAERPPRWRGVAPPG